MLPPGHVAAGYLTAKALLHFSHTGLSIPEQQWLLAWGMLFGFLPDLDTFVSFAKEKAFMVREQKNNHRKFISHAPLLWLLAGLLYYSFAQTEYGKLLGLLLWLGSWSHFVLDTIQYGIMWLWPFGRGIYALKDKELDLKPQSTGFWIYWITFLKAYAKQVSFYLEVLIIFIAIFIAVK